MNKYIKHAGADVSASIVVLLVALPLCLGIALGSGAPLFSGIIAGVVGGIVIGALSGSQLSVSGPAAGLTVIVATAITKLQVYEAFLLAVVLAGLFQLIFGFIKAGVIGDYVPNAVIKGMLAAIGLILIMKQFPHLVGYDADFEGDESFIQPDHENTFSAIFSAVKYITPTAFIIGAVSLILLMLWESKFIKSKKTLKLIPGPLVVVLVGTLLNEYFKTAQPNYALEAKHLVALPVATDINSFISFLTFPDIAFLKNPDVWISGITIAIVASLETLLGIEAADKLDPLKRVTPTNRELKAQGVGNMLSGLIGGLPLTSVVVRTSANISAGAKSKMSTIYHGVMMMLCVMFIPFILNKIPLSALAAVLIFTGYKLAKITLFKDFYKKGWDQFVPFVVTIAAILLTDLLIGIIVGIGIGLFFMIRTNFRSAVMVVNDNKNYLIRFRKDVSFLNKPIVKKKLEDMPSGSFVIIDATRADFIDKDVIEEINNFLCHAHLKKIKVEIKTSQNKSMHDLFVNTQNTEK
ncbi:SulP family inorganic anion transporter [Sediminibacterium goheungense]|uniref:MFS superfamily sulfate permease-like transporter n=1 Tax=Sediminibacterium goheungense TaxID=1086393 RepID=A0A4R6J2L8_9BACT|nr:SulP family inorganic anion transporter [Sediminibacterium goheungense]TDO29167.1 MFS superfamily sulfate permease-like transporter [Sediminibacterium goheungense]